MIFLDASAIVSVVTREEGCAALVDVIASEPDLFTSPLARWEAVISVRRKAVEAGRDLSVALAETAFEILKDTVKVQIEPITAEDGIAALEAFARYGRGMGSKANLNMADCFHYAVTRRLGASILFTSPDEFHHTDLPCALAPS